MVTTLEKPRFEAVRKNKVSVPRLPYWQQQIALIMGY